MLNLDSILRSRSCKVESFAFGVKHRPKPIDTQMSSDLPLSPRTRAHQPFPFVETPAKAKLAGSVEAQLCVDLATLPALCVVRVPIIAPRQEGVRRERVMFGFHCRKLSLNITDRRSESFECVLKACRPHHVQSNITGIERQTVTGLV